MCWSSTFISPSSISSSSISCCCCCCRRGSLIKTYQFSLHLSPRWQAPFLTPPPPGASSGSCSNSSRTRIVAFDSLWRALPSGSYYDIVINAAATLLAVPRSLYMEGKRVDHQQLQRGSSDALVPPGDPTKTIETHGSIDSVSRFFYHAE